ncbi:MAG: hypothetical protein K2X29_02820, partial [Candidatus Obscuribacterales bacterium]|nr:hypothetical protein [Candidatus Obscuribacterales bacterium]
MKNAVKLLAVVLAGLLVTVFYVTRYNYTMRHIGIKPLVLTFAKSGDLMQISDGRETKAPKTIHVRQWQEVDFVHNSDHAEFKIDRAAANDLFLQYQGTEQ